VQNVTVVADRETVEEEEKEEEEAAAANERSNMFSRSE
jgi:hypothetical protein